MLSGLAGEISVSPACCAVLSAMAVGAESETRARMPAAMALLAIS